MLTVVIGLGTLGQSLDLRVTAALMIFYVIGSVATVAAVRSK